MQENFQDFLNIEYALIAFFISVLICVLHLFFKRKKINDGLIDSMGLIQVLKDSGMNQISKFIHFLNKFVFIVGLVFLLLALARPQSRNERTIKNSEGISIMMVLDISDSMLIEDMRPTNRLEAAKLRIKEFIEKRISDSIGLVVFSGQSYTRIPLTLDYALLLESLAMVQTSERLRKGTAIGVALANAITRLEKAKGKSKVIILLTDGENNVGSIDPITSLQIAKQNGIKIYTVGVGKDGLAQLPIYKTFPNGMVQKYYRPMQSKVNESLLKQMAAETGGAYFRATQSKTLDKVFYEINELEKTDVEVKTLSIVKEHYQFWLFWGLLLVLMSQFLEYFLFWRAL